MDKQILIKCLNTYFWDRPVTVSGKSTETTKCATVLPTQKTV